MGKYRILEGKYRVLEGKYKILVGKYRVLVGKYRILEGKYRILELWNYEAFNIFCCCKSRRNYLEAMPVITLIVNVHCTL